MVSPWMKHGTILKYLESRGRGDIGQLTLEIAQGLEYLHSMSIVHGDLRGNNILISDNYHACLADFGLATTVRDDDGETTTVGALSSSADHAGSARWLPPKEFGCEKFNRTRATDVYAFACVCLEMRSTPPFAEVATDVAAFFRVIAGERPEQPDTMSDEMWYLVTAAWAPDFRQRPDMSQIVWLLQD
ncbi:kinase-like domain-containing protein [Mycena metata]|uniref:Kinase-like domain-containing protein n=1 Tax=Mycena metata TaxID=1033252 RepID=A0AAD7IBA0_9AGAR|nr:kinase-like domain-containing protein [Mycena metata]